MSVIVVCVYKYKILFLFNVIDYSRFLKSVFFYVTLAPGEMCCFTNMLCVFVSRRKVAGPGGQGSGSLISENHLHLSHLLSHSLFSPNPNFQGISAQ